MKTPEMFPVEIFSIGPVVIKNTVIVTWFVMAFIIMAIELTHHLLLAQCCANSHKKLAFSKSAISVLLEPSTKSPAH